MTQNARQLPSRSTDCTTTGTCSSANKRLDLSYAFDANGNVGQITDNTSGGQQTRPKGDDLKGTEGIKPSDRRPKAT